MKRDEVNALKRSDPNTWSVSDVAFWLTIIDMDEFQRDFIENSISGDVLFDLTPKELKSIGVARLGQRKKLMTKIRALRKASKSAWNAVYDDDSRDDASDSSSARGSSAASSASRGGRITLKIKHKGTTTAMKVDKDISFRALSKKIKNEFGDRVKMSYIDEDGDVIALRKQSHLEDALEDMRGAALRLKVTVPKKKKSSRAAERGGESSFSSAQSDILEGLLDATCVIDESGKVLFFNKAAEELWGFTKRSIHGKNIKLIMPPDTAKSHDFYLWKFSRGEGGGDVVGAGRQVVGLHRDGYTIPIHLTVTHSATNHTLTGVFKDMRSERRKEGSTFGGVSTSMLDNLLQCVIIIDCKGTVLFVNKAATSLLGYSSSELQGRNVNMLMPPPYKDEHDGYLAKFAETGKASVIGKGREVAAKAKDGTVFPVKLSVTQTGEGDLATFTGILEPVNTDAPSTRKSALEADRDMLESLVVAAVLIDEGGRIQVFNDHASKLWGFKRDAVLGKNVRMLMGSPDREKHDRYLKRYLRTGESKVIGVGRDVLIQKADGSMAPAKLSVTEKKDEAGKRLWTAIVQAS